LYDLYKTNKEFNFYNIARPSAGNHIIKHIHRKKIIDLLQNGIEPENIYSTIQLSGICRPSFIKKEFTDIIQETDEWKKDYFDPNNITSDIDIKKIHVNTIQNLQEIIDFIDQTNINAKIFWGWTVLTKDDLVFYGLIDKMNKLETHESFLNFKSQPKTYGFSKITYDFRHEDTFGNQNEYGGMNEVAHEYNSTNKSVYISENDHHLNSLGNSIFYENFYKNIFKKWNIL
jgi:hypothetical protein